VTLSDAPLVAFVGTTDFARARAFYAATLGLALVGESPLALEFDCAGTMLRVTKVKECRPAPYTVLGWRVEDIGVAVAGLAGKGVRFERYRGLEQDDAGIWKSPGGARVAWFKDLDGNTLSLMEPAEAR
jgi:catechol 2,3-dioxygenase-like lactoylglutathione lyase family enzyme